MTRPLLEQIIATKPELDTACPSWPTSTSVIYTTIVTFPIGGTMEVVADPSEPRLAIVRHYHRSSSTQLARAGALVGPLDPA